MKIISRNTAGLNRIGRLHSVFRQARAYSIAFLQETKIQRNQLALLRSKWGSEGIYLSSENNGARRGVLTLIHPNLGAEILQEYNDDRGQFIILIAKIKDEIFLLGNIYSDPDLDANAELTMTNVLNKIQEASEDFNIQHMVLGGDWNFVLQNTDTTSTSSKPRAERVCRTITTQFDLIDVAAIQQNRPLHTYFVNRRQSCSARYDRFYVSNSLMIDIKYNILNRISDHAPISIEINRSNIPGQWRFSDALLNDPVFMQKLHDELRSTIGGETSGDAEDISLADMQRNIDFESKQSHEIVSTILRRIRQLAMDYMKKKKQDQRRKDEELIKNLIDTRSRVNTADNPSQEEINAYEHAKQQYTLMIDRSAQAASLRNHVNYATHAERMSRYHFQRHGRGKASRDIAKLIDRSDGNINLITRNEVPQVMFEKYKEVLTKDPISGTLSIEDFLGNALSSRRRTCPQDCFPALIQPISPEEIKKVVNGLKTNCAPGPTGLTNNLFKHITPFIIDILVNMGNKLLFDETMPNMDRYFFHRTIIFILKPGKECTNPDSYRGLSLLEVIYKIYAKILANRMEKPLQHIQSKHQFGFTRNKSAMEASRTVIEVVRNARKNGKKLIVLSTDFRKAFDSINLDHIEACLNFYGFPEKFVTAFMRFVRNGTASFEVNSVLSEDHTMEAGTGQGDPKSTGTYNLSAAPLNFYLSCDPEVPRYKINNTEIEPIYFADDDLLLLKGDDMTAILVVIRKIIEYRRVSGLHLNPAKCEIMDINCNEDEVTHLIDQTGMKRVTKIKHLGLTIDNMGRLPQQQNLDPITEKMERVAQTINTSSSTPIGRALYAKYLLASRYLHVMQNVTFTEAQQDKLWRAIKEMTWTRHRIETDEIARRTHIAQERVIQPFKFGGLSLPHPKIQSRSTAVTWLRKFVLHDPNSQLAWEFILNDILTQKNCPNMITHLKLGYGDWIRTGNKLELDYPFWSNIFMEGAELIRMVHNKHKEWSLIPILGHEDYPTNNLDISTLSFWNPAAKDMINNGLVNIGQLFKLDDHHLINTNNPKDKPSLEREFNVQINNNIWNSLQRLREKVIRKYRGVNTRVPCPTLTTLPSIIKSTSKGCSFYTKIILWEKRQLWTWGDCPKSFSTYQQEQLINISQENFIGSWNEIRKSKTTPSTQWTSFQINLRTLWNKKKEHNTRRGANGSNLCLNCNQEVESTTHMMVQCNIARQIWDHFVEVFDDIAVENNLNFRFPPLTHDNIMFNYLNLPRNYNFKWEIKDIIMIAKHQIYKIRFRENIEQLPRKKQLIILIILEIEKLQTVRSFNCMRTQYLREFTAKLRQSIGF